MADTEAAPAEVGVAENGVAPPAENGAAPPAENGAAAPAENGAAQPAENGTASEPATNGTEQAEAAGKKGGRQRVSRDTTTVKKFQRKKAVIDQTVSVKANTPPPV